MTYDKSPTVAFFTLTERCNLSCAYCFHQQEVHRLTGGELDAADLERCLVKLKLMGIRNLIITGGEPLISKQFFPFLDVCRRLDFGLLLLTNGLLLNEEVMLQLRLHQVQSVSLSCNQLVQTDDHRDRLRLLDWYEGKISLLTRHGFAWISAIIVISRRNFRHAAAMISHLQRAGAGIIVQPIYVSLQGRLLDELGLAGLTEAEWNELCQALDGWSEAYSAGRYLRLCRSLYAERPMKPAFCGMGTESLVVRSDGSVLPCFHRKDLRCGSLLTDSVLVLLSRLREASQCLEAAPCFGEHCVSLFTDV